MKPSHFIAFKAVWCIFVGLNSVFAGFMSATCEQTFVILRRRFSEQESALSQGSSWRASRNGRSMQNQEAIVGMPNIKSGDL